MPVTIDNNNSFYIKSGDMLYSEKYQPMFKIIEDTVGTHDLIHPMCRKEMYKSQYGIVENHPSCYNNIQTALKIFDIEVNNLPTPLNIFMNTIILSDGSISVEEPKSKADDYIILEAEMNMIVAIAACSVEESKCNGFKCSAIKVEIYH